MLWTHFLVLASIWLWSFETKRFPSRLRFVDWSLDAMESFNSGCSVLKLILQSGWCETRGGLGELLNDQTFILIAKENHLCREFRFPKQEYLSCFTRNMMLPILWFFIRPSPCSALPEFKKSINRGWNEAGRGFEGAAMARRVRAATNAKDAQELLLMIQRKQSTDGY